VEIITRPTGKIEKEAIVKEGNGKEWAKKAAIGRAAAILFEKKGYLETSLKDISEAVKLSKGCIYYYFSNKHEILYFILDVYMDHLLEGLEDELRKKHDIYSKIQFIMHRHLSLYNNKIPEAKAILTDAHNLPHEYYRSIALKQKKYSQLLADVLSDYFDGEIQTNKAKAISYIVFGMCNSIMHWHDPEGPITLEELSEICFSLFTGGIHQIKMDQRENV
jgi:AcrR family transcriptional regulator